MRPGGALFALLASLLLLLLLRLLWCWTDAPARSRFLVEESREATYSSPAAPRKLRSSATLPPRTGNSTCLNEKSLHLMERCQNLQAGLESLSNRTGKLLALGEASYRVMGTLRETHSSFSVPGTTTGTETIVLNLEVSRPHPSDHPLLILFMVGGVTVSEAKMIKDLVPSLKPGTQVIVLSTRLLKPLNIPELLFATDRLHPDLGF